ncbi:hypothetical protein [Mycobacterium lepromatosis]|uniref:hypothetical protein n=1 Tax=Mycobacterium lepromatosis TaxID=480418 RepID=UPI000A6305C7|nr:hypothetical protein [Mycobacterium lepromatosis]
MIVVANVAFGPRSYNTVFGMLRTAGVQDKAYNRHKALGWPRQVNAEQCAERKPRQLPGGKMQRLTLACLLAPPPECLFLDELLTGLYVAASTAAYPRGDAQPGYSEQLRRRPDNPPAAGRGHHG